MIRRGFAGAVFAVLALVSTVAVADGSVKQGARDARSGSAAVLVGDDAAPRGDAGFLTVTTDPAAKLEIDGADTGKTTPVVRLSLASGKHKVTVTSLDGKTKRTLGVTIVAGEEKRLTVNL